MESTLNIKLHTGALMPQVGFGCYMIDNDKTADVVHSAIKVGYRCIDQASVYGNEKETGQGIEKALNEGIVNREDLFVVSKLWCTHHRKEHVKLAVKKSLEDLGLDYLDLYLIHFPLSFKYKSIEEQYPPSFVYDEKAAEPKVIEDSVPLSETWAAMEELVSEGLVKHIGLSNYPIALIRDLLSYCKIRPAVLQVELHPYNAQEILLRYCKSQNIAVAAHSQFGPLNYVSQGLAKPEDNLFDKPEIKTIATKHGKTAAQVLLRWAVQRGYQVIPKSCNTERQIENFSLADFTLSDEEMKAISAFDEGRRFADPGHFILLFFNTHAPIYD